MVGDSCASTSFYFGTNELGFVLKFTTSDKIAASNGVKVLVYGKSGVGKTLLCKTAPKPVIVSIDPGMLSLKNFKIPTIEIDPDNAYEEMLEVLEKIKSGKLKKFETICLDSISELGENILAREKLAVKDNRQAYGSLLDKCINVIKKFRDLSDYNVYFTAKLGHFDDEGVETYFPSMPSARLSNELPYLFDEVFYMTIERGEKNKTKRVLNTRDGFNFEAGDRSGYLLKKEKPNLTAIFDKIAGKVTPNGKI